MSELDSQAVATRSSYPDDAPSYPEKRRFARLPAEIWMEEETGDALFFRRTCNLSEGGACFDQAVAHAVGTRMRFRFTLPNSPDTLRVCGEVVGTDMHRHGIAMRVRFVEFAGDSRERLRQYVASAADDS